MSENLANVNSKQMNNEQIHNNQDLAKCNEENLVNNTNQINNTNKINDTNQINDTNEINDTQNDTQNDNTTSNNNAQVSIDINYFKQILKDYLKLEEEISTLQKALKQRKTKQESLNHCLLNFLNQNCINEVQLEGTYQGQQLAPQMNNKTKGANKADILNILESKLKDNPEILKTIKSEIENLKETVQVEKVKISKIKAKKPKKNLKQSSDESNNLLFNN